MKSLVLLAVLIILNTVSSITLPDIKTSTCPIPESKKLSSREYFKTVISNSNSGNRHHHLLDKHVHKRKNHFNSQTVFDKVINGSSSKHEWKQWQSMYRTILLSSLHADNLPDILCVFATILNHTIEIENGDQDKEKFMCTFDMNVFTQIEMFYGIAKNILAEQGCSTSSIPTALLPKCYDPSGCVDGGVNFMFGEIWQEFNGTMDFLSEDADHTEARDMYSILKPVYDAGDLYGKYVVAITTIIAMEFDWLVKTKQHDSLAFYEFLKVLGLFEEVIESPPKCDCENLQTMLLERIQEYVRTVYIIIDQIKISHSLVYSQGHVESLKNKHSNKPHH